MPDLLGFNVWVEMHGRKLKEYELEHAEDNENELACWIPGDIGAHQNFRVGICIPTAPRTSNYAALIYVDGTFKSWRDFPKDDSCPGGMLHKRYIEDLKFARFEVRSVNELMGRVLVTLTRYESQEPSPQGLLCLTGTEPLGSITFRYRGKETLVSDGIAPPSRPGTPDDIDALIEELSKLDKEMLDLGGMLRELSDRGTNLIQRVTMKVLESTEIPRNIEALQQYLRGRQSMEERPAKDGGDGARPLKKRKKTHGMEA